MFEVSICTMIKGENSYLAEWVAYHTSVGVDHFFVYDNESPTRLVETLDSEVRNGVATVVPIAGRFKQLEAFNDGLRRFGSYTRWMAFIDLDEFMVPKKHSDLKALLREYEEFGGLGINWQMFGSSGHQVRPKGLQIEAFVMRAPSTYAQNRHIKSVVRPERVESVKNAHSCTFHPPYTCVNENKVAIHGPLTDISVDVVQISHYYTRSRQEFSEKLMRGRVDRDIPMAFTFDDIDPSLNEVRDDLMLGFVPKVRALLDP